MLFKFFPMQHQSFDSNQERWVRSYYARLIIWTTLWKMRSPPKDFKLRSYVRNCSDKEKQPKSITLTTIYTLCLLLITLESRSLFSVKTIKYKIFPLYKNTFSPMPNITSFLPLFVKSAALPLGGAL